MIRLIDSAFRIATLAIAFVVPVLVTAPLHAENRQARDTAEKDVVRRDSASRRRTPEEQKVAAAIEAVFKAAEENNLAALDSLYAGNDLTIIESTGINRGWTDYRDHHLAPEMKEMKRFRYRPFEIEPHVTGNLAWAIFRYNLKAETGGRMLDLVGRGTAILEKRGAQWVVRHTHTASRARRPTDPPAGF